MALKPAPKAVPFVGKLHTFFQGEFFERCGICGIDVHWDDSQI